MGRPATIGCTHPDLMPNILLAGRRGLLLAALLLPAAARAQDAPFSVFLDCSGDVPGCD